MGLAVEQIAMQHNRVFRITLDDIDDLRDFTRDQKLVNSYEQWIVKAKQLDAIVRQIEEAFAGETLGDGIGLLEANGIDDYASAEERAELRLRDEKTDWRCIDTEILNRCYSAPSFFDARGFIFHLPAFLIAELNDQFSYGFIDRLINSDPEWINLLTDKQRDAIATTLCLIIDHPEYRDRAAEIEIAIKRFRPMGSGE